MLNGTAFTYYSQVMINVDYVSAHAPITAGFPTDWPVLLHLSLGIRFPILSDAFLVLFYLQRLPLLRGPVPCMCILVVSINDFVYSGIRFHPKQL